MVIELGFVERGTIAGDAMGSGSEDIVVIDFMAVVVIGGGGGGGVVRCGPGRSDWRREERLE